VVTHHTPFDSIQKAFTQLEAYEDGVGKSVIQY